MNPIRWETVYKKIFELVNKRKRGIHIVILRPIIQSFEKPIKTFRKGRNATIHIKIRKAVLLLIVAEGKQSSHGYHNEWTVWTSLL